MKPYASPGDFRPDLDDVISSKAYRRLANKSQVMVKPTKDHFRSRLIHTIEVDHIASAIAAPLELNVQLVSAMAMAHDLGHTPFAHAGERTIQTILARELPSGFDVPESGLSKRKLFHHSSNSARILLTNPEYDQVQLPTVHGVLTHSWSPWAGDQDGRPVPISYEGQVVAIADQLASINHDTEDIIDGAIYTNYDFDRFYKDAQAWIKKRARAAQDIEEKMGTFLNIAQPGYGRKRRVSALTAAVVKQALQVFESNKIASSEAAKEHPIALPIDWMVFLQSYERFIRQRVVQRESWFVGRDAIAEALVSSVFNHIWPRFKTGKPEPQIALWPKEDEAKGRIEEERQTIKHYSKFHDDDYAEKTLEDVLRPARSSGIETWDCYLVDQVPAEVLKARGDGVLRLISVIDFVAGLTDRYCLEIFDRVYHSFTV